LLEEDDDGGGGVLFVPRSDYTLGLELVLHLR
jgi:hypothetical protein